MQQELEELRAEVRRLTKDNAQYKQVEGALRESEEKYRTFVQTIPDIVYTIDQDGIFTFVSDYITQLGYQPEELIGKHFSVILHGEDLDRVSRSSVLKQYVGKTTGDKGAPRLFDERRTRMRKTSNLEVRLLPKDQEGTRDVLIDVVTEVSASGFYSRDVKVGDKKFMGTIGVIRDITERKKQERALQESEGKLKGMLDAISDLICMMDRDLNILWANEMFKKVFGSVALKMRCDEAIQGEAESGEVFSIVRAAFEDGLVHHNEIRVKGRDGETLHFDCTANVALRDSDGNPITVVYILRDISEYKRIEDAKRASQEFARNIIDSSIDMIIAVNWERKVIEFNRAAREAFGYSESEVLGQDMDKLYADPAEGRKIYEEVRQKARVRREIRCVRKNGEIFPVIMSSSELHDAHGEFVGVMGISRDITELKKMEEELLKAQKLESIGILAGGIAHDFNNILTALLGNVSLAQYARSREEVKKRLKETEKAALRAKDLTQQLLTFSRGGAPVKKTADIQELIEDSVGFALRGSNVRCEYTLPEGLWTVAVDEGQMSQVINNMVINAVQAMPNGGIIGVESQNVTLADEELPPLRGGTYVRITVKDRGIGIPGAHLSKIFDPYFSTKQKGSGLGLATSYAIIQNHEGTITVESELGIGTRFHVYLPALPDAPVDREDYRERILPGTGNILVMDDEEPIRDILNEMLAQLGYGCESAIDGEEAIRLYRKARESGKPFDAVIMDLTIPGGMGGKECLSRLLEFDPNVKAIVSSGYSNDPVMASFSQYGFCDFVSKPFRLEELSEVLNRVL